MKALFRIGAACLAAWCAGFAWFAAQAWRPAEPLAHADGIVVLTGGAERVAAGLRLLEAGVSARLLISGVGGRVMFDELAQLAGAEARLVAVLAPKVTLGRAAASTHGNAMETAQWARTHAISKLGVVTAGYHMPRALAELRRQLPWVVLVPAPVQPPAMHALAALNTWRLLVGEYVKFLAVISGIAHLAQTERGGWR